MNMFRIGMAIGAVLIGGAAALIGFALLFMALKTGTLTLLGGESGPRSIAYASDPHNFMMYVGALGVLPLMLGTLAARWGMAKFRD